jgi:hypothetical protein
MPLPSSLAPTVRLSEQKPLSNTTAPARRKSPRSLWPAINPSKRKPRRPRPCSPDPASLYDLMHQYAGTSLFVRPICWTDLHAKLLGAQWAQLPRSETPAGPQLSKGNAGQSRCHMRPSEKAETLCKELTAILSPTHQQAFYQIHSIKMVLSTLYPDALATPDTLSLLSIYFGGRQYRDAVRVQLLWNHPTALDGSIRSFDSATTRPADSFYKPESSEPPPSSRLPQPASLPMLAYIGRPQLHHVRSNPFRIVPGPGRAYNKPVAQLQELRAKLLVPSNLDHDAHLLGIFLAMAQRYFYTDEKPGRWSPRSSSSSSSGPSDGPEFHDVRVQILTHDSDTGDFIVYTAVVSAATLKLFHVPTKTPEASDASPLGIKVEYCKVPIWPILGLKERLGKALGRDVVGEFDEEDIEMWEEETRPVGSLKRKEREGRSTLSEMFNRSFEESESESEGEQHEVEESLPKRRCVARNVGVVA